jgi:hypothetical protein
MKTGFFRGFSEKNKEQKETAVSQALNERQRELEVALLDFMVAQEKLRDEYEKRRAPVIEQIGVAQKRIEKMETDGSLEDRWFACEALVDAVNAFLQRKTIQPN